MAVAGNENGRDRSKSKPATGLCTRGYRNRGSPLACLVPSPLAESRPAHVGAHRWLGNRSRWRDRADRQNSR